jgi:redox-sensitive bicupin YhaK (pirin superfamily)
MNKKLAFTQRSDTPHWVGDGFPVRTVFSYHQLSPEHISPFLLMDYAGPADFKASQSAHRRGVEEHPHRGFETVTIVYSGQVEHRDSAGGGGVIGDGEVQWMTAASGLVHEEKHGKEFSAQGGQFEMVQLWVNLPAKDKMSSPRYQGIKKSMIKKVDLENNAGFANIIAGELKSEKGPAKTFTPINLWDVRMNAGATSSFQVPSGHTSSIFVLSGKLEIISDSPEKKILSDADMGILSRDEENFTVKALEPTKFLYLGGEPIREPVVGYGPFVMNTQAEILQAMQDYEQGRMGHLQRIVGSD